MNHSFEFSVRARQDLSGLPPQLQKNMAAKIIELENNPASLADACRKLPGCTFPCYRIRLVHGVHVFWLFCGVHGRLIFLLRILPAKKVRRIIDENESPASRRTRLP